MEVPSENLFTVLHSTSLHYCTVYCTSPWRTPMRCNVLLCAALRNLHGIYLIETNEMPTTDSECQVPFSDISTYYPLSLSLSSQIGTSPRPVSPPTPT